MTPVVPKKRTRKDATKKTPLRMSPAAQERRPDAKMDGLDLTEVLLDISSRLQATEFYIEALNDYYLAMAKQQCAHLERFCHWKQYAA